MTKPNKKAVTKADREPYPVERRHMDEAKHRIGQRPRRVEPVLSISGEVGTIDAPHSDKAGQACALMDTFATTSDAFVNRQLCNLASMGGGGAAQPTSNDIGAALAIVGAVEPQNELEAALAVQIAMTHQLAASLTMRAQQSPTVKGMTDYGNLATKAARTFTAQLDALTRLRSGGKQVVEHRHYNIDNRGGQTVVAEHMTTGVSGNGRIAGTQSHGQGAFGSALPSPDATGNAVSVPGSEGAEPMQITRRERRGTNRKPERA